MLIILIFALICALSANKFQFVKSNNKLEVMAHAVSDVLATFAADDGYHINIRTCFFESEHLKEMRNEVIRNINDRFTYTIKVDLNSHEMFLEQSSLILLDSIKLIKYFIMNSRLYNMFPKHIKFLIYCENATLEEYKNIRKLMQQKKLNLFEGPIEQILYFILEHKGVIGLGTISWFRSSSCNKPSFSVVKFFNKTSMTWEKNLHKYEKFTHFYGCKLIMPVNMKADDQFNVKGKSEEDYEIGDMLSLELTIFTILSNKYNFSTKIQRVLSADITELFADEILYFDENFKEENYPTVFLKIFHPHNEIYSKGFRRLAHYTTPFFESKIIFLVTPGELYTSYEKLYLPFDLPTWILLFITFGAAFAVIFLVNFTSQSFQVLVYGQGVKIPSLNVVSTFFGIGQTKLPNLSFSRFILLMFIIFCLIIRTAYQGVLFELITSQPRRPEPKDFQGLVDQNYKIYTYMKIGIFNWKYQKLPEDENEVKNRLLFIEITEDDAIDIYATQWNNGSAKLSLVVQHQSIPVFNSYAGDYIPWIKLENPYQTILGPFAFFPNHFLYQVTNEAVQRLTSAGIMQYLYENDIKQELKFEKSLVQESEPQVFALNDLDFGFCVWLGSLVIAIFVFLIELFGWLPKKYGKKNILKEESQCKTKNFVEDLGIVFENDAVEGLLKELAGSSSCNNFVTEITVEDLNEIEEIEFEEDEPSQIFVEKNSCSMKFAKIHPFKEENKSTQK